MNYLPQKRVSESSATPGISEMPLAVLPVLALTTILSSTTTTLPPLDLLPTVHSGAPALILDPNSSPLSKSLEKGAGGEQKSVKVATTRRLSPPSWKGTTATTYKGFELASPDSTTAALPPPYRGARREKNADGNPSQATASFKKEQQDPDRIDQPPLSQETEIDKDGEREQSLRPVSWPNLQPALSISEFLHRFAPPDSLATPDPMLHSLHPGSTARPRRTDAAARPEDISKHFQEDMMRTVMSSLFERAGVPAALSHFVNAFTPMTTPAPSTRRPTSVRASRSPAAISNGLVQRWIETAEKLTSSQTEGLSGRGHLSPEEMLSADSSAAKKHLLDRVLPVMEHLYSNARNSSLQVPPRNPHAFDAFELDKDDMTNSFLYKFFKHLLIQGVSGRNVELNGLEDLTRVLHKLANPTNVLSLLRHATTGSNHLNSSDNGEAVHVIVHEDFEANFDDMNEEKWFQTPEFVVSVSVLSAVLLLALITCFVTWFSSRKSSSFPVSRDPMNYEPRSKSQILYI